MCKKVFMRQSGRNLIGGTFFYMLDSITMDKKARQLAYIGARKPLQVIYETYPRIGSASQ